MWKKPDMRSMLIVGMVAVVTATAGCASRFQMASRSESVVAYEGGAAASLPGPSAGTPSGKAREIYSGASHDAKMAMMASGDTSAPAGRDLIKNGRLTIETRDVRGAVDSIARSVAAAGGYVGSLHETVDGLDNRTTSMEVRVPAARFEGAVSGFSALGKVLDREVEAEDVTDQYVDMQARLRNLNTTEARLLFHLRQTGKLSDTLLVEKELSRVREELEQIEGRLRLMTHQIQFSTVDITLQQTAHLRPVNPPESFSSGQVATDAARSLAEFGRKVWGLFIWLAVWAILWVPALVCLVYLMRIWSRRRANRKRARTGFGAG